MGHNAILQAVFGVLDNTTLSLGPCGGGGEKRGRVFWESITSYAWRRKHCDFFFEVWGGEGAR